MSQIQETSKTELDLRPLPIPERQPLVCATFESLQPGEAFVLLNDHDPRPRQFTWEYLEHGPETWQVRIGRAE